jgi:hypothetical protein
MSPIACPNPERLFALAVGELPESELMEVAEHLDRAPLPHRSLFVPDAVVDGSDRTIASSTARRIKEASGRRGSRNRVPGPMARNSHGWPIAFQRGIN